MYAAFIFFLLQIPAEAIQLPLSLSKKIVFECTVISDPNFKKSDFGLGKFKSLRVDQDLDGFLVTLGASKERVSKNQIIRDQVDLNTELINISLKDKSLKLNISGKPLSRNGELEIRNHKAYYFSRVTCH